MKTENKIPENDDVMFGSITDFNWNKKELKTNIILGYFDDRSKAQILSVSDQYFFSEIQKILNRSWIGSVDVTDSVAYNLKKYYNYNIEKDSGFNKSVREKLKQIFIEIPKQVIIIIFQVVLMALLTAILILIGLVTPKL